MAAEDWTRFQFRWGLGQVVALIALVAVCQLEFAGSSLVLVAVAAVALLTVRPQWLGPIQRPLTRWGPKLILVAVIIDFVFSRGDVVPPLVRTLSLLLTYRALELRHPRQDRQLVLLSLLLLLMAGTLTADLIFAVELFLFVPVALFLLAVVVADERGRGFINDWREPWRDFSWRTWWRRNRRRTDRRILVFAIGLYGFFGLSAMGLFWSLPRFDFGHQLPFLRLPSHQSLTGFSEEVNFGEVVSIQQDTAVAMRVDAPPEASMRRPYWRMMVLDEYLGRGFRQSESARAANWSMNDSALRAPGDGFEGGGEEWTHFLEGGISRQIPVPGRFGQMRFTARQSLRFNTAVGTIALRETSANMLVYRLDPVVLGPVQPLLLADRELVKARSPIVLEDGDGVEYPATTRTLPGGAEARAFLEDAVAEIRAATADDDSMEVFVGQATAWLQAGRGYSLETDLGRGADPLIDWMRRKVAGHCELYAGSLVLLARQAGYPARLVTGFHGGIWNGFEDYFMVRHADAHAWVEVFDPDVGWRRFDPTPGNGEVPSNGFGAPTGLAAAPREVDSTFGAYVDSLRVLWYRKVVNFDHADQEAMVEAARDGFLTWGVALKETFLDYWTALKGLVEAPLAWSSYRELIPMLTTLLIGLLCLWGVRRLRWSLGGGKRRTAEGRVRRSADRWLERLPKAGTDEVRARLQLLRYGDPATWESPRKVFRAARQARRAG